MWKDRGRKGEERKRVRGGTRRLHAYNGFSPIIGPVHISGVAPVKTKAPPTNMPKSTSLIKYAQSAHEMWVILGIDKGSKGQCRYKVNK